MTGLNLALAQFAKASKTPATKEEIPNTEAAVFTVVPRGRVNDFGKPSQLEFQNLEGQAETTGP